MAQRYTSVEEARQTEASEEATAEVRQVAGANGRGMMSGYV
jgi:hypothetical protein